jgi:hypothetical protein
MGTAGAAEVLEFVLGFVGEDEGFLRPEPVFEGVFAGFVLAFRCDGAAGFCSVAAIRFDLWL